MLISDPNCAPFELLPSESRNYPEWHHGRPRYTLWSVPIDAPSVLERIDLARVRLGTWLHSDYTRQPHLTLFVCGFPNALPQRNDDIHPQRLQAQREALRQLCLEPFALNIGGLDSFTSAPILRVEPCATLQRLRTELAQISPEIRQAAYVPHITIGLYRQRVERAAWLQRCAGLDDAPLLAQPVSRLELLSYQAAQPWGPLQLENSVALNRRKHQSQQG